MRVGGITPFSATDYPGLLSTVVFVQGCPWRCVYCHNPHLQTRNAGSTERWGSVCQLLSRRKGLIDAVVFSGGEPCADGALSESIRQVLALGFKVGLHTGGMYPRRLAEVLPLVDWVGLDIKGEPCQYDAITGRPGSAQPAFYSLQLLIDRGVDFEVRTTLQPGLHTEASVMALAQRLMNLGVRQYALQEFRATGCAVPAMLKACPLEASADLLGQLGALFERFSYRAATG